MLRHVAPSPGCVGQAPGVLPRALPRAGRCLPLVVRPHGCGAGEQAGKKSPYGRALPGLAGVTFLFSHSNGTR